MDRRDVWGSQVKKVWDRISLGGMACARENLIETNTVARIQNPLGSMRKFQ